MMNEYQKRYYIKNKDKIRIISREWVKNNRDKVNNWARKRHIRYKEKAVLYLGGKCQSCGYDKSIKALEFHHKNSNEKKFCISSGKKRYKWEVIQKELNKCELLCANCHREIT